MNYIFWHKICIKHLNRKHAVFEFVNLEKWLLGCACIFSDGLPKSQLRRYHTRTT